MLNPNRVILQSRLNAYNTPLGREMASQLNGYESSKGNRYEVALGLVDELLTFWEEHHGTPKAAP